MCFCVYVYMCVPYNYNWLNGKKKFWEGKYFFPDEKCLKNVMWSRWEEREKMCVGKVAVEGMKEWFGAWLWFLCAIIFNATCDVVKRKTTHDRRLNFCWFSPVNKSLLLPLEQNGTKSCTNEIESRKKKAAVTTATTATTSTISI